MQKQKLAKLKPDWLTFLSAVLIVFAFPPWNFAPLIWVALVPWFFALQRAGNARKAALQGAWLSFFMSLGGFYWVASVLQEFGELPWAVAVAGLVLFAWFGQPQFTLFAPLWARLSRPGVPLVASVGATSCLALAYAGLDWVLPKLFVDTLGHSLYQARNLRQAADLGGATLLTFLIFGVNEGVFRAVWALRGRERGPRLRAALAPLGLLLAFVAAAWAYGLGRRAEVLEATAKPEATLQAGVIQANIGDFDKIAAERGIAGAAEKVLGTFFRLSDEALSLSPKPQVLIWPETSYPSTFRTPQNAEDITRDDQVTRFVRDRKVPLLFGGYDHFEGKDFNAFFFLSPTGGGGVSLSGDLEIYRKNVLLLFGEYIPGAETFPFIKTAFPQVGNFGRGVGPTVLKVRPAGAPDGSEGVRMGPIICYEALFPNYIIEAARRGSQMILNITNDSWFGPHGEPELHLSLTTFRSIETRLPQLRSTNTGISALILPDGEITHPTRVGEATILNVAVPMIRPIPTLMKTWGDWFGPVAFIAGWAWILWVVGLPALRERRKTT